MRTRWKLRGIKLKDFVVRVWYQTLKDDIFGYAAQLSYYFLFSLFPLLICLTALLGIFADTGSKLRMNLLEYLSRVMPESATELISRTLDEISKGSSGTKLSLGLIAALWTASSGMGAIINALNVAYNTEETRSWWKTRLIAIGLTIIFGSLLVIAATLMFYGGTLGEKIADSCGLGNVFTAIWKIIQLLGIIIFVLLSFSIVYFFGPDLKNRKLQIITPGAVSALVLWIIVTLFFKLYLHRFDNYSATYGSLGAVIILLLWFYLTGAAILIGGEINAELEKISQGKSTEEAPESGK